MENREQVLEFFRDDSTHWREQTDEGIERNRKGDAVLRITDAAGNPCAGVSVSAVQKSHAFRFGANLFMLDGIETPEKQEAYKTRFADLFNMATLPFYWDSTEPTEGATRYAADSPFLYRRPPIDLCLNFCAAHGIEPREHALAYDRFFPRWLYDASVERVKAAYETRCRQIAARYADKIPTIEVTNEMEWQEGKTAFYDEPDFVEFCFKTARKYFPHNQLGINEHQGLAWGDRCRATDKYYAYIEANLLKGVPIDAIGMQFHMFHRREKEYTATRPYYDPHNLRRHMDLYAAFGLPLQVTEVTIPAYTHDEQDEAIQAELIENLYRIWFSHPAMEQIIYWNLTDGYAHVWTDDLDAIRRAQGDMTLGENRYYGGLLRFDMSPKPAYTALKRLICEEWHTEATLTTDADGKVTFRGFYGDYTVTLAQGDKTVTRELTFTQKNTVPIKLIL